MSCFILGSENIKTLAKAIIDLSVFTSTINVPDVFRNKNLNTLANILYQGNIKAYHDRYDVDESNYYSIDWENVHAADIVGSLECGKIFQWHFDLLNLISCYHYQICDCMFVDRDILEGVIQLKNSLANYIAFNDPRMGKGWKSFF